MTRADSSTSSTTRTAGGREILPQDVCRLTVLARTTQVDMALPIDVPLCLLIPGIVDMIARGASSAEGDSATAANSSAAAWTLARIGFPPLSPTATLAELSVRDGELLVLGVADSPTPMPLFDDLMHSVARSGDEDVPHWTPATARVVGSVVTAAITLLACAILLRVPIRAGTANVGNVVEGIAAITASVLFAVTGLILGRVYGQQGTGVLFGGCAVPLMFTGGALLVPGAFGAAHLLLGASMAGAVSILSMRIGNNGFALFTATTVLAAVTLAAAVCVLFTTVPYPAIGTYAALVGLAGVAVSARISMMQARLPLPPVPTAGAPLDTSQEAELDAISFADLETAASRARSYLTGLLFAFAVCITVGVLVAAAGERSDRIYWPGIILAGLCALVLMLRGRTYAVVSHAVPLVAGGITIVSVLLLGAAAMLPEKAPALFVVALATAVTATVFGAFMPTRTFSPVLRRAAELVEYATIGLVIPIAVWVCGLYATVRGL